MKNVFKTMALAFLIVASSCSKDDDSASSPSGSTSTSFIKARVGDVSYDSTVNGQATVTKVNIPIVGDQITISSAQNDGPKTLNLTFIGVTGTGTFDTGAVVFYSPNGTNASSIGNDDSCDGVGAILVVTKYESNLIEGTFTAQLKKSDCSGAVTPVTNGSFKATF
jgi:hypothetical protein